MKKWYVVRTKANQEIRAQRNLETQGFNTFCPMLPSDGFLKPIKKIRSLFPSYLFIELDLEVENWSKINNTFGVKEILRNSSYFPCPIQSELIVSLKKFCFKGDTNKSNFFDFKSGQKVKLVNGPFLNNIAEIINLCSKERVSILLEIFSRKIKILVATKNIIPL
tara:strand:+ start:410 stop:904 length:495 start_codon:yes stop_codon:yes gene_type:complete